jgi:AraC-like DNA-binding protein
MHIHITLNQCANYAATSAGLKLEHIWLLSGEDNAARTVRFQLPEEYVVFATLPGVRQSVLAGGVEFRRTAIAQHHPGRDYHQTTAGPTLTNALFVPAELTRAAAALAGVHLPPLSESHMFEPAAHALHRLLRLQIAAIRLVQEAREIIARDEAMRGLEAALVEALIDALRGADVQDYSDAQANHEAIIKQFDAVLAAKPDRNLFMADVCAEIGVSPRTLRACCDQHLGMGPKHFLMLRRLHLVRRLLLDSAGESASVTDAATAYGFWELGRFSVAYRELFGESPSATLRRHKDGAAQSCAAPSAGPWFGSQWAAAVEWFHAAERGGVGKVFEPA